MYQPPPAPQAPPPATQWAPFEHNAFIPPGMGDEVYPGAFSPAPPPGRGYAMYRQPPSWQHASMAGLGGITPSSFMTELVSNVFAIAMGAGIAYFLVGTPKAAVAGGAAMVGALQVPLAFKEGSLVRALIAAGAIGGAYWFMQGDSQLMMANPDDDSDDDDFEPNEENDGDDFEPNDDPEPVDQKEGPRPPDDADEPLSSSPWMKSVGNPKK